MQRKRVDEQQAWLEKERQKHNAERELAALNARRKSERTHAEIAKWAEKLAKPCTRRHDRRSIAIVEKLSRSEAPTPRFTWPPHDPSLPDGLVWIQE